MKSSLALLLTLAATIAWAGPPISFDLAMEPGFPQEKTREWVETLKDYSSNLRFRNVERSDKPEVTNRGTEKSPRYQVIGLLTMNNQLILPGGKFRPNDKAGIGAWIAKLEAGGVEELSAVRGAFGLTAKEFVALHEQLGVKVNLTTQGKRPSEVVSTIVNTLNVPFTVDAGAARQLAEGEMIADEFRGLSAGTVLAAIGRPCGAVLVPRKSAKGVGVEIVTTKQAKEFWPVGWPPQKSPKDTMPELFRFLPVEIANTPLSEAVAAIQERLESPLLVDRAALVRKGIDMSKINVSLPSSKTYYKGILDRLLFKAKLTNDVRIDEAGKPFLWITTGKNS